MRAKTAELWAQQDRHTGDRHRLFGAVAEAVEATTVLYAGSYVDVAASFVWPAVTYVDVDRRAAAFFDDVDGVHAVIVAQPGAPEQPEVTFVPADYTTDLPFERGSFDLLISLYAGPISRHCTRYLRVGGSLLVNPSHGDAALASIDDRYELSGVVRSRSGAYSVSTGRARHPSHPEEARRDHRRVDRALRARHCVHQVAIRLPVPAHRLSGAASRSSASRGCR